MPDCRRLLPMTSRLRWQTSGLVPPRPDVRGIDQVFNFFAVPGIPSCFEGAAET
jgi:hypothetical protein